MLAGLGGSEWVFCGLGGLGDEGLGGCWAVLVDLMGRGSGDLGRYSGLGGLYGWVLGGHSMG